MKGYKGFNKTLQCRGKQYEIGKEYAEESAKLCKEGLHFCEYPLDVFNYYPPSESAFCEVDAPDDFVSPQTSTDSKRVSTKLTIGAKLELHTLIEAAIKFTFDRAKKSGNTKHATGPRGAASATGYQGAASATGYQGAASATGYQGAASATGPRGAASATGERGAASATGERGAASATGYQGAASATGYQGAASATGYQGAASATGPRGAASATGYQGAASATGYQGAASATGPRGAASATGERGAASATGPRGAAIALGIEGKAKASLANWIILSEWEYANDSWERKTIKAFKVDGKKMKADTYYTLKDGEAVEAE